MIIDCISDLHGYLPELQGGDLLIIAGDLTESDKFDQYMKFKVWLEKQDYKYKVLIAGNHDGLFQNTTISHDYFLYTNYLCDSSIEIEGLKIWGSPWTPTFYNWHFMKNRGTEIKQKWDLIPNDTDILVTHGPAYGVLDGAYGNISVGCEELRDALERVKPRLHIFGHIHEGYGKLLFKHSGPNTICVNASIMDENYIPVNKPIRIEL